MTDDRIDRLEARIERQEERIDELEDVAKANRDTINDHDARLDAFNRARMTLFDAIDELREKVDELLTVMQPDPNRTQYDQLTKEQKIHRLRVHLVRQAGPGGKYAVGWREVRALFDGHPSRGHTYDLMRAATAIDGFTYDEEPQHRVSVKSDAVNDDAVIHAANTEDNRSTA